MIIEGYWGYPNMVWTGMNMILPVGQSQLQRSAARLAPCVQHGTSILELCQCSSELSTHCQWKHSKCTKVHWSWYDLIWFMIIYTYNIYNIICIYIYNNNNLAKFNCTVSLCVLILLPRIRADLSETQTSSAFRSESSFSSQAMHGHAKLRHRLHYAKTAIGEKCPITRPLETLSPECAEGETDTDGYTLLWYICTLQKNRKTVVGVCKMRQTLYNRHSKIGKTRIARQVGAYRATNAWCSALVEHLQFGQLVGLVGTNPSHFSLRTNTPKLNKLKWELHSNFCKTWFLTLVP